MIDNYKNSENDGDPIEEFNYFFASYTANCIKLFLPLFPKEKKKQICILIKLYELFEILQFQFGPDDLDHFHFTNTADSETDEQNFFPFLHRLHPYLKKYNLQSLLQLESMYQTISDYKELMPLLSEMMNVNATDFEKEKETAKDPADSIKNSMEQIDQLKAMMQLFTN